MPGSLSGFAAAVRSESVVGSVACRHDAAAVSRAYQYTCPSLVPSDRGSSTNVLRLTHGLVRIPFLYMVHMLAQRILAPASIFCERFSPIMERDVWRSGDIPRLTVCNLMSL